MKGFLACNHPVKINTLRGVRLVSCGKCIQCLTRIVTIDTTFVKHGGFVRSKNFVPYE